VVRLQKTRGPHETTIVGLTATMDATHIANMSAQDYTNAFLFGGLAGGTTQWANWYFKTSIATPLVTTINGTVGIGTSYVPEQNDKNGR